MNWDGLAEACRAVTHEVATRLRPEIERAGAELAECLRAGGKLLICGNGGSAADAQHMSGELVNRFLRNRRPYAAIALSTDASVVTSIGNDFGFAGVFEKQVQALGRPGDVLVAFSTSGNSENVVRARRAARAGGLRTVALSGGTGGRMRELADRLLCVTASAGTPRIQEGHEVIMHALCEIVEETLEGAPKTS